MAVSTLQNIAFFTSIRHIWKASRPLHDIICKEMQDFYKYSESAYISDKINGHIDAAIHVEIKKIVHSGLIADTVLLNRFVQAYRGISQDIVLFFAVLLYMNKNMQPEHVAYVVDLVVITQTGRFDGIKTFQALFRRLQDRSKATLNQILRNLVQEFYNKSNNVGLEKIIDDIRKTNITNKESEIQTAADMSETRLMISVDVYWEFFCKFRFKEFFINHTFVLDLYELPCIAVTDDRHTIESVFRKIPIGDRHDKMVSLAKYSLRHTTTLPAPMIESLKFVYDNMDSLEWSNLLEYDYYAFFLCFLSSWRYRLLCVDFFLEKANTISIKMFKRILKSTPKAAYESDDEYSLYEINRIVLKKIWMVAPDRLKNDESIKLNVIPRLVISDFYFASFIESYAADIEVCEEIAAQIFILLTVDGRKDKIAEWLDDAGGWLKCVKFYTRPINKNDLKTYLLFEKKWSSEGHTLLSWFFGTDQKISKIEKLVKENTNCLKFKEEIMGDHRYFIRFTTRGASLWLNGNQKKRLRMFWNKVLLDWGDIDEVRQAIIKCGYNICRTDCDLLKPERLAICSSIREHPDLLSSILSYIIVKTDYSDTKSLSEMFEKFFKEFQIEDRHSYAEHFIIAKDGLPTILDLFIPRIPTVDVTVREIGAVYKYYLEFIAVFLKRYGLVDLVTGMLEAVGHPNMLQESPTMKACVQGRSPQDLASGRILVDAYYRFFRAALKYDFKSIIADLDCLIYIGDVTYFSQKLTEKVDFNIPVVI